MSFIHNFEVEQVTAMWKGFLVVLIALFTCINVAEVGYFSYHVLKYYNELSNVNLAITIFINLSTIFFTTILILGVLQSRTALLRVWIVYAVLELSRSSMTVYDLWVNTEDSNSERVLATADSALQFTLLIVVFIFLQIIKSESLKTNVEISTIAKSIELGERNRKKSCD